MVSLTALWLPILLSAVAVFIASSVIHMALKYHNSEYQPIAQRSETVLDAMRAEQHPPCLLCLPPLRQRMKEMGTRRR